MFRKKRGQSTLEYGLIIAVVVAALLTINWYMQKGVQGKLKENSDQIGRQFDPATFANSWKSEGQGNTITAETRDTTTGSTTSNTIAAETVVRSEAETWGNVTPQQHF